MKAFRELLRIGEVPPFQIILLAVCSIAGTAAEAGAILSFVGAIAPASDGSTTVELPILGDFSPREAVAVGLSLVLVRTALFVIAAVLPARLSSRTQLRIRQRLVSAYLESGWETMAAVPPGEYLLAATSQAVSISNAVLFGAQSIAAATSAAVLIALAIFAAPAAALAMVAAAFALGVATRPLTRVTRRRATVFLGRQRELAEEMTELQALAEQVRGLGAERGVGVVVDDLLVRAADAYKRTQFAARSIPAAVQGLGLGLVGVVLLFSASSDRVAGAGISVGLVALLRVMTYVQQFQACVNAFEEQYPNVVHVQKLIATLESGKRPTGTVPLASVVRLEVRGAAYSYVTKRSEDTSTTFAASNGQFVVLSGESGSGKSTLLRMIGGLVPPTSGSVLVNGVSPEQYRRSDWAASVAYVPQEVGLLSATIRENVALRRPGVTEADVVTSLDLVGLGPYIASLPAGIDTQIADRRDGLSGGQRQRIALARALVSHPTLLLLDEPSSALDEETEEGMISLIRELSRTALIVAAAHRPAMIDAADLVIFVGSKRSDGEPVARHEL